MYNLLMGFGGDFSRLIHRDRRQLGTFVIEVLSTVTQEVRREEVRRWTALQDVD